MKRIYITWHNASHGIGFTKNVLAAFSQNPDKIPDDTRMEKILLENVSQAEMERYFDACEPSKFVFDRVLYLYTDQSVINQTTSFAFSQSETFREDPELSANLRDAWQKIRDWYYEDRYKDRAFEGNGGLLAEVRDELKKMSSEILQEFNQKLWRFIHYFPIEDQTHWLKNESNLPEKIKNGFEFVNMSHYGVRSLRDRYTEVCDAMEKWKKKSEIKTNDELFINISYGSYIVQVAFFVMTETGMLPQKTYFLNSFDSKNDRENRRFKNFTIAQAPTRLFSDIRYKVDPLFKNSKSSSRKLAGDLLSFYLNERSGAFCILILGERGVGKSRLIEQLADQIKKSKANSGETKVNVVQVNCASFDDDSKAESELFGYVKGAFTGAGKDKDGLFMEANGGILFLDEVHALSRLVQAKLMKALQTDEKGQFKVRRMGETREKSVECHVIFASNRSIAELRDPEKGLLPDFYDRIAQFVVEIPPLRNTVEDRYTDWQNVWRHLFKIDSRVPDNDTNGFPWLNDQSLLNWLTEELLPGNFRDLEKIALAYKAYLDFPDEIKQDIAEKSAYEYAKSQYRMYHGALPHDSQALAVKIDLDKSPKAHERELQRKLAQALLDRYGSPEKAESECKKKFGNEAVTAKTLRNWQKGDV